MFGKKKCQNCGEKVSDKYNFCPYCKAPVKENSEDEDWGMLGRNDFIEEDVKFPMGLNVIFNSLLKNLNKQFKELDKETNKKAQNSNLKKSGISISISTSGNKPPEIKVRSFGDAPKLKGKEQERKMKTISLHPQWNQGKTSGLPKREPETNIRRLSNKVVYEIRLPGVKSVKDISIIQLENSIEIKALAKDKLFYKVIPISLPIRNYNLSKGTLTLELDDAE